MKKEVVLFGIFLFLMLAPFLVSGDETTQINNAYSCLANQVNSTGCSKISFEGQVFSLMASGLCKSNVMNNSLNTSFGECWPKASCNVKSTAQAVLALAQNNENTTATENWLLAKTIIPSDLDWFIEVETSNPASCKVGYLSQSYSFTIGSDKKISTSSGMGSCLSLAQDGYWLKVSPNCYNMDIDVSCDDNFLTTLLFQKTNSPTIHVSNEPHTASAGGTTTEKIDSLCFAGSSNTCDYEGSLWATTALYAMNRDVSKFMPYLVAMSDSNSKFLPESFLYIITGKFRTELLLKQQFNKYWDVSTGLYNSYYDTALALLPFQYESPTEKQNSKNWLLTNQGQNGCWNSGNIRDTAFILYSIWPRSITPPLSQPVCGNNIKEVGEQCDGTAFGSLTCSDIVSGSSGNPTCNSDCTVNSSSCIVSNNPSATCGNNLKETGEQCDGTDFGNLTCSNLISGYAGNLTCNSDCTVDSTNCESGSIIGNECTYDFECNTAIGETCFNGKCVEGNSSLDCASNGGYCMSQIDCSGELLTSYSCSSVLNKCCSEPKSLGTCQQDNGGIICSSDQTCSGGISLNSTDVTGLSYGELCCVGGFCKTGTSGSGTNNTSTNTCETIGGGTCRTSCFTDEQQSESYTCSYGDYCCVSSSTGNTSKKSTWLIWVLLALILISALGIIFKDKLKTFILKLKTKGGKGHKGPSGIRGSPPIFPPRSGIGRLIPRRILPKQPLPQGRPMHVPPKQIQHKPLSSNAPKKKVPEKSKPKSELDDVLKKLKEMGN